MPQRDGTIPADGIRRRKIDAETGNGLMPPREDGPLISGKVDSHEMAGFSARTLISQLSSDHGVMNRNFDGTVRPS